MKALFCGGGTAGHVIPAVAIAEALLKEDSTTKVKFIGRQGGNECDIIKKRGFSLSEIKIEGLSRKPGIKSLKSIYFAFEALKSARKIIKEFNPDVIIGTGGYVCWPVLTAGRLLGIPTVIHESNATPGLTTRLLAGGASSVLLSVKECADNLKRAKRICVVGTPSLNDFDKYTKSEARKKLGISPSDFFILSFGGSGGAEAVNTVSIALMKSYSRRIPSVKHLHATGKSYYDKIKKSEPELVKGKDGCKILSYINNMPEVMQAADVVISRCGAMTLAEMCMTGSVGILIPSPNVTDNHQYKNAKHMSDMGAAILIEEKDLSLRLLVDTVGALHNDEKRLQKMSSVSKSLATPGAEKLIVEEIYQAAKTKKRK